MTTDTPHQAQTSVAIGGRRFRRFRGKSIRIFCTYIIHIRDNDAFALGISTPRGML